MLTTLLLVATTAAPTPAPAFFDLGDGATVRALSNDVWLYVSERASDRVASNSLVLRALERTLELREARR